MRLFGSIDDRWGREDRAAWITPPFDLILMPLRLGVVFEAVTIETTLEAEAVEVRTEPAFEQVTLSTDLELGEATLSTPIDVEEVQTST